MGVSAYLSVSLAVCVHVYMEHLVCITTSRPIIYSPTLCRCSPFQWFTICIYYRLITSFHVFA